MFQFWNTTNFIKRLICKVNELSAEFERKTPKVVSINAFAKKCMIHDRKQVFRVSQNFHLFITLSAQKKAACFCTDRLYAVEVAYFISIFVTAQIFRKTINAERNLLSLSSTLISPPFDLIFSMRLYGTVNDLTKIECMLVIYPYYIKAERQNLISACCLKNIIIAFQIFDNSFLLFHIQKEKSCNL